MQRTKVEKADKELREKIKVKKKRGKVQGQRNCEVIRNSVKETVSLLLKNKSYCPSENDSITACQVKPL